MTSTNKFNMKHNKKNRLESEIVKEPILQENPDFDLRNPKLLKFVIIFDALINLIKELIVRKYRKRYRRWNKRYITFNWRVNL